MLKVQCLISVPRFVSYLGTPGNGFPKLFASPLVTGGVRRIAISVSVCLSVGLSVCSQSHISRTACPNFTKLFTQVTCGRVLVLSWRQCIKLNTSTFVDDVTFAHNDPNKVLIHRYSQVAPLNCASGSEVCCHRLSCYGCGTPGTVLLFV